MNSLAWKPSNKTLCQKIESKIAEKVKYLNFYPHRRPFLDSFIFRQGHPGFQTVLNFSSKMGSGGIKSPIYLVIMMIWNYDPL